MLVPVLAMRKTRVGGLAQRNVKKRDLCSHVSYSIKLISTRIIKCNLEIHYGGTTL